MVNTSKHDMEFIELVVCSLLIFVWDLGTQPGVGENNGQDRKETKQNNEQFVCTKSLDRRMFL